MNESHPKIFASSKVSVHQDRIQAYLDGERIYPVTMELDLTQRCTRACPECPYSAPRQAGHTLELPFLEKLFGILGPHTPGLVLSGGEATSVSHFPEVVALARAKGFKEIAVITNGTRLHVPEVQDALLKHVTSVRVSMYDWQEGDTESFLGMLKRIRALRDRLDREGGGLEIGAAMLTRVEWTGRLADVGRQVLDSGVDWLYFHPYCIDWETNKPVQADQAGVLDAIEGLIRSAPAGSNIQVPRERYSTEPLHFEELHGAHFLIQVGADGVNYAGPECKYHEDYALLDLKDYLEEDFLWHPQRIGRLKQINSRNYRVIGTKHRPPMISHYIEQVSRARSAAGSSRASAGADTFLYPEII